MAVLDALNWPVLKCPQLAGFEVSPEAGYYEQVENYRPSELRYAFTTAERIAPVFISFIEQDIDIVCSKLLEEIERMTRKRTFGGALKIDFVHDRVYRL